MTARLAGFSVGVHHCVLVQYMSAVISLSVAG